MKVPNVNYRLVNINQAARLEKAEGPSTIQRNSGMRNIRIDSDIGSGSGVGNMMNYIDEAIKEKHLLPPGVTYSYQGQGEQYDELTRNLGLAAILAILFIYLVLASLYESFVIPFALLIPLPLAVSGAVLSLWIVKEYLNVFSMIGTIMLLGIATKNSILLLDYTKQLTAKGMELSEALITAGKTRLRPIIMTSLTLVAGTIPVAIGLNEAGKQRTSMGVVIVGGVITSTLLTLVVVPAAMIFGNRLKWFFFTSLQHTKIYFKEARYYLVRNTEKFIGNIVYAFLQILMNFVEKYVIKRFAIATHQITPSR